MTLHALPLDFDRAMGYALPKDRELHRRAIEFAEKEVAEKVNYSDFAKVWVAEDGDQIVGTLGMTMRPDFTLCRFLNPEAIKLLHQRGNDFLADQGLRGGEALIYMNSKERPEQKCPEGLRTVLELGARPADRWIIRVR